MTSAKQIYLGVRRGAPTPPLPYDAEVEYLESTGTQYINIGDAHDFRESMFVLRAMQTAGYWESAILGSQEHSRFELYLQNGKISFWSGNDFWTPDTVSFPINQIGDVTLSINGSGATVTSSGQTSTASGTSGITGVEHLQIFSYRTTYPFTGRIYFVKVYVSNALTLDLIPVRFTNELGQSEGAMYDRVSGQVFRNAGTGAFKFGTDIAGGYEWLGYSSLRFSRSTRLWKEAA